MKIGRASEKKKNKKKKGKFQDCCELQKKVLLPFCDNCSVFYDCTIYHMRREMTVIAQDLQMSNSELSYRYTNHVSRKHVKNYKSALKFCPSVLIKFRTCFMSV